MTRRMRRVGGGRRRGRQRVGGLNPLNTERSVVGGIAALLGITFLSTQEFQAIRRMIPSRLSIISTLCAVTIPRESHCLMCMQPLAKDLEVKSPSPPPATLPYDPAIIQPHYPQPGSTTSSLLTAGGAALPDLSSQPAQRPSFQSNIPLSQSRNTRWGSSDPPPAGNGTGLSAHPMYWQGYYAPPGSLSQHMQQPPMIQPTPGLSAPQTSQYPGLDPSSSSGAMSLIVQTSSNIVKLADPKTQAAEPLLPALLTHAQTPQKDSLSGSNSEQAPGVHEFMFTSRTFCDDLFDSRSTSMSHPCTEHCHHHHQLPCGTSSSPPPPPPATPHNDSAIFQLHYPLPGSTSSSLLTAKGAALPDLSSEPANYGFQRPSFQSNIPLSQSGSTPWGSSDPPPAGNGTGLSAPLMYWQGYYAPPGSLSQNLQQPPMIQPTPGLSAPQTSQYPGLNPSSSSWTMSMTETGATTPLLASSGPKQTPQKHLQQPPLIQPTPGLSAPQTSQYPGLNFSPSSGEMSSILQTSSNIDKIVQLFVKVLDYPSISIQMDSSCSVTQLVKKALHRRGMLLEDSYVQVDGRTISPDTLLIFSFKNSTFSILPRMRGGCPEIPESLSLHFECQSLHNYIVGLGDLLFEIIPFTDPPCQSIAGNYFVTLSEIGRKVYNWLFILVEMFHANEECLHPFTIDDIVYVPELGCLMFYKPRRCAKSKETYRRNILDIASIFESHFRYSPRKFAQHGKGIHEMNRLESSRLPNHLEVLVQFIKDMPRTNEYEDGLTAYWRSVFLLDPAGMSSGEKISVILSLDLYVKYLSRDERKIFADALGNAPLSWKAAAEGVPAMKAILDFEKYDMNTGQYKHTNYVFTSISSLWLFGRNYLGHSYNLKMDLKVAEAMFSFLFIYLLPLVIRALIRKYHGPALAHGVVQKRLSVDELLKKVAK